MPTFLDFLNQNPGLVGGLIGGIGTLIDPAEAQTTTQQTQVNLPEYIAPYVGRMLGRAEGLSQEGYTPYSGQRLADFTPDQLQAFQNIRGMQAPDLSAAQGTAQTAASRLLGTSYAPGQFSASPVSAGTWDSTVAGQYMSPYMQGVTDIARREAVRDFESSTIPGIRGLAAKSGAYGGARQGILESEAYRNLGQQLSDIQTKGLQDAYTSGAGLFTSDRNAALQAALANQGVGMQAQQLGEQSRQYGAGLGYHTLTAAPGAALTGANIGQQGFQNQNLANQNLLGIGTLQQGLNQAGADVGYQQFQQQQQQPYQQAQYMQSFLQGLPMTQYATASTTPAPSMFQQMLGNTMSGYYGLGSLFGQQPQQPTGN